MAKLRYKITDSVGVSVYVPSVDGWTLTVKETKESSAVSLSTLATGLATISLEGYLDSVGFVRGIVVAAKNKNDHIFISTLIGSRGFNLTGEVGWSTILSIRCYVYADILNMNCAFTYDTVPL